jgi:gold/copper resistance efflux pump
VKIANYFIHRPISAVVLSILLLIAGTLSFLQLPLAEYPQVSPPTIVVTANYPGASPEVIAATVASPLEQEIKGVQGLLYTSSQSTADGRMTLTLTFAQGIDPDTAEIQVQNRVSRGTARLPAEVQALGVITQKTSPDVLMVVHLLSGNGRYDPLYVSNFALLQVRDTLLRLEGVGQVDVWGAGEYSMRVWLDPDRIAARKLTVGDVVAAINAQNVQVVAGSIGQQPRADSAFQMIVNATGRLTDAEAFGDIVVQVSDASQVTRLRDVARIELASDGYARGSLLDNRPAVAMLIIQKPGSSALLVSAQVRRTMATLASRFPAGINYDIVYDPTIFVGASIDSVVTTLFQTLALVALVILVFLRNWRASIIPIAAVPVSIIGTLAVMLLLGFTLNTLSLFGLVLSIGIVVDDAIVVVENVQRHIARGLSPKEAARTAMIEVTGPVIATTAVLVAVFAPTALLGELTGQFYRQFALTIAISTVLSTINSLTLSPALAAILLRPREVLSDDSSRAVDRPRFQRLLSQSVDGYLWCVSWAMRFRGTVLILYVALLGLTAFGLMRVPLGFVPTQDKSYLVGIAQLPDAAALHRTEEVVRRMTDIALADPGVANVVAFPGVSVNGLVNSANAAVAFVALKPFTERRLPDLAAGAVAMRLNQQFSTLPDGFAAVFPPPPVPGLGAIDGFKLMLQDRAGLGLEALHHAAHDLISRAAQAPEITGLMTSLQVKVPRIQLDIDHTLVRSRGVALGDLNQTLQAYLGSLYVNDFNLFGRSYRVIVQADAPFRMDAQAIGRFKTRNDNGEMVSLASLVNVSDAFGPDQINRYNSFIAADISGSAAPGFSSGQAMAAMARLADEVLPPGMGFEWTELAYQQQLAGNTGFLVFLLAVSLAFLILAAQYNSWRLPAAVVLTVPLCLLGAILPAWLSGGDNNIFTQIGLVVLVGLAAKNAILIVEFAREREAQGRSSIDAALEACRLRLRPILMTSISFIAGVLPLVLATGAGAEMRQAMGTAVFFGMLGVTLFGLFFTPVLYVLVQSTSRNLKETVIRSQ